MAPSKTKTPEKLSVREAARYLQDKGVDVGELRMRTLARQHEIFVKDPNTGLDTTDFSDQKVWQISTKALDQYIEAVKKGVVRSSNGSKAYRVSLDQSQLDELRTWCKQKGIAEPVRANKAYTPKAKAAAATAEGADTAPTLEQLATQGDSDQAVGSDFEGVVDGDGLFDDEQDTIYASDGVEA